MGSAAAALVDTISLMTASSNVPLERSAAFGSDGARRETTSVGGNEWWLLNAADGVVGGGTRRSSPRDSRGRGWSTGG